MLRRIIFFIYGVTVYILFFVTKLYLIGFLANLVVSKSIDKGPSEHFTHALFINIILIIVFAVQHSIMARQKFKNWWTKIIPQPIERSTYVLFASLLMLFLFYQWRPIQGVVWNVDNSFSYLILSVFYWIGWLIAFYATFLMDGFALSGLRQVYLYLRGKEYTPLKFKTPLIYKYVRHPSYLGFIIAFFSTPLMTIGHLIFAITMTIYIFIGIYLEEKDMVGIFGEAYRDYQLQVPMLIPFTKRNKYKTIYKI